MASPREEIAAQFRAAIDDGRYLPDSVLPRAVDIAEQWQVSRQLVQDAFGDLQAEGLVQTVKRRGTVVLNRRKQRLASSRLVQRDEYGYLFEETSRSWAVLRRYAPRRAPASEQVGELLQVPRGTEVLIREELHGVAANRRTNQPKDAPMQLVETYSPGWLVDQLPILVQQNPGPGGVLDRIEENLAGPLSWTQLVGAESASLNTSERLRLPAGAALLRIHYLGVLPDGRPVELCIRSLSGTRFQLGPTPLLRHVTAQWPPPPATLTESATEGED